MGLFEHFPYSNFHAINLDWVIEQVKNTIDNAVMSVNGQNGEVILYQSENVVFPDVQSDQWRMVRTADGHIAGVLFNQDYMYVMYDNIADRVYTMNHPPAYPVTSVDGQTGDVKVFPDAATRLPDVTNDYTNIRRQIETNGTQNIVGIELKQDKAYRMKDAGRYEIYDSANQPPYPVTSVNGQTGAVILAIPFTDVTVDDVMFVNAASGHEWGIGRETTDGTATIQIITDTTKAEAYIDFFDEGGQVSYTKKLLTTDDIPSSSGVVSVNGQTGVVTIYGDTMPIESGSADSVKDVTDALDTRLTTAEGTITQHGTDIGTNSNNIELLKSDIAIVENTNNATHNIASGQYVVWKGSLYTALSNIAIGDGLSASNLAAVPNGGLNDLGSQIATLNNKFDYSQLLTSNDNLDNIPNGTYHFDGNSIPLNSPTTNSSMVETIGDGFKIQTVTTALHGTVYFYQRRYAGGWAGWQCFSCNNFFQDTTANTLRDMLLSKYNLVKDYGVGTYTIAGGWAGQQFGFSIVSILNSSEAQIVFYGNADTWSAHISNNAITSVLKYTTTTV